MFSEIFRSCWPYCVIIFSLSIILAFLGYLAREQAPEAYVQKRVCAEEKLEWQWQTIMGHWTRKEVKRCLRFETRWVISE